MDPRIFSGMGRGQPPSFEAELCVQHYGDSLVLTIWAKFEVPAAALFSDTYDQRLIAWLVNGNNRSRTRERNSTINQIYLCLLLNTANLSTPTLHSILGLDNLLSDLWRVHTARNRDRDRDRERDQDQWVSIYYVYCSHCTETGTGTWPIVSYCAGPVPRPCPGPGSVQCE